MNTPLPTGEQSEVLSAEHTQSAYLVKKIKEIKTRNELTYPRILEMMEANGTGKMVSKSTLRRVLADSCDPDSFSYAHTLCPIYDTLKQLEDDPGAVETAHTKEVEALKNLIHSQDETIAQLYETKHLLEGWITTLMDQIEKKDRRMDTKDEIIRRLMEEKDTLAQRLMEKAL